MEFELQNDIINMEVLITNEVVPILLDLARGLEQTAARINEAVVYYREIEEAIQSSEAEPFCIS